MENFFWRIFLGKWLKFLKECSKIALPAKGNTPNEFQKENLMKLLEVKETEQEIKWFFKDFTFVVSYDPLKISGSLINEHGNDIKNIVTPVISIDFNIDSNKLVTLSGSLESMHLLEYVARNFMNKLERTLQIERTPMDIKSYCRGKLAVVTLDLGGAWLYEGDDLLFKYFWDTNKTDCINDAILAMDHTIS